MKAILILPLLSTAAAAIFLPNETPCSYVRCADPCEEAFCGSDENCVTCSAEPGCSPTCVWEGEVCSGFQCVSRSRSACSRVRCASPCLDASCDVDESCETCINEQGCTATCMAGDEVCAGYQCVSSNNSASAEEKRKSDRRKWTRKRRQKRRKGHRRHRHRRKNIRRGNNEARAGPLN